MQNRESTDGTELDDFYRWFWEERWASEHTVAAGLGPLVEATRTGEIAWSEVTTPTLVMRDHPDLETVAKSVKQAYLETTFRDRPLVILVLRDWVTVTGDGTTSHRDGYYLAARRPNGTLTAGVWPEDSASDLMYEISQAPSRNAGAQR